MTSQPIRLLVVDDHEVVRQGLRAVLAREPHLQLVGEAAGGEEALALAARLAPDVVLLDIRLPDVAGVDVCRRLKAQQPGVKVIFLTAYLDDELVEACIQAGAEGYLLKDVRDFDLRRTVWAVVRGEAVLDSRATSVVLERLRAAGAEATPALTERELAVLRLMAEGLSNREIGERLHLSEHTIKDYVAEVVGKLAARNRVEAVAIAIRQGMI